jgi:Flp pilus assembly protein TadG
VPRAPRAHAHHTPAQALLEFAFILPATLILLLGMIELGRALVFGVAIQNGAREAARLAAGASYDTTVDDKAVVGRFIGASQPALGGCSVPSSVTTTTITLTCGDVTWTLTLCVDNSGTCNTIATARSGGVLTGHKVTLTGSGSVALLSGLQTGLWGLSLATIGVQGQAAMVVL